jgi:hypothetical protein
VLTESERHSVQKALAEWAQTAPDEPLVGFLSEGCRWTPKELVDQVWRQTPDGKAVLELLEHGVRREGLDKVVSRLRRQVAEAL